MTSHTAAAPGAGTSDGVRFQTCTSNPARSRFPAIGAPMVPVPSTAMMQPASASGWAFITHIPAGALARAGR